MHVCVWFLTRLILNYNAEGDVGICCWLTRVSDRYCFEFALWVSSLKCISGDGDVITWNIFCDPRFIYSKNVKWGPIIVEDYFLTGFWFVLIQTIYIHIYIFFKFIFKGINIYCVVINLQKYITCKTAFLETFLEL